MKGAIVEIIMWVIVASLVVLVVMNPKGFASAVANIGGLVMGESRILSGSGYQGKGGG
jgi:hypothetical protein